ncbi:hypothetical protein LSH36_1093g00092 [Paralvinella palmiformis]|uniref:Methyltransferase FkbM domain-containing protein n=1 Tax=Paralvinella palmiformis TaxID=53620 RepID=A0AAD9IV25_9ANNE|nr:hypothetical protein LSH36_1093g00092 [Paralvinella palmiformis]
MILRVPKLGGLALFFAVAYLSLYLFYRNSVIKLEKVKLRLRYDRCKADQLQEMYIKDLEFKVALDLVDSNWKRFSGKLKGRRDRKSVHKAAPPEQTESCTNCLLYETNTKSLPSYNCIPLKVKYDPRLCLYPDEDDISLLHQFSGVWESDTVQDLQKWLERDPELGFIDVGCHIGPYTLAAAILDTDVLAVDSSSDNLNRLIQSLKSAGLESRVTVLKNFVGDITEYAGHVSKEKHNPAKRLKTPMTNASQTVTLDDLLPLCKFQKALLRLDVNGSEHRVFQSANVLFQKLFIPLVLMDWHAMKPFYWHASNDRDRLLVELMIEFFLELDYIPVDLDRHVLHTELWDIWPSEVLWAHKTFQF